MDSCIILRLDLIIYHIKTDLKTSAKNLKIDSTKDLLLTPRSVWSVWEPDWKFLQYSNNKIIVEFGMKPIETI